MSPGCDGDVVGHVDRLRVRAFHEQLQPVRRAVQTGNKAQHLTAADRPARGCGEIQFIVAPPDAFAPRNPGRAGGMTALGQVAIGRFDVVQIDPFDLLPVADSPGASVLIAGVGRGGALPGHRLKPAALGQLAGRIGNEAIEQAGVVVFGQIDDAGAGIDADGLVIEAAHRLEGHGIDQAGRGRRHFEDPPMALGHMGIGRRLQRFLAGQPTAPRRRPAAAVGGGSGQRQISADHPAGRQIIDDGGTAAGQGAAILVGVVAPAGVQQVKPFLTKSAGTEVAMQAAGAFQLVIDDQGHARPFQRETSHAVRLSGSEQAVVHRVAALGHDLIGKAFGQIEQAIGIAQQRAVAMDIVDVGLFTRRLSGGVTRQSREGGGGARGDQTATMKDHEGLQSYRRCDARL